VNIVVFVNTVLLALLCLLMIGLLRGHAELMRRTSPTPSDHDGAPELDGAQGNGLELLPRPRAEETPAYDIAGTLLDGGAQKVSMRSNRNTLLAFLSSGCSACVPFWEGLREVQRKQLPGQARIVVVSKDPDMESPSRLEGLVRPETSLIMSSRAYADYKVELSPYFIYVEGRSGQVLSEGTAATWPQVLSLLKDAIRDRAMTLDRLGDPA
jgi:hypothetical protein